MTLRFRRDGADRTEWNELTLVALYTLTAKIDAFSWSLEQFAFHCRECFPADEDEWK